MYEWNSFLESLYKGWGNSWQATVEPTIGPTVPPQKEHIASNNGLTVTYIIIIAAFGAFALLMIAAAIAIYRKFIRAKVYSEDDKMQKEILESLPVHSAIVKGIQKIYGYGSVCYLFLYAIFYVTACMHICM